LDFLSRKGFFFFHSPTISPFPQEVSLVLGRLDFRSCTPKRKTAPLECEVLDVAPGDLLLTLLIGCCSFPLSPDYLDVRLLFFCFSYVSDSGFLFSARAGLPLFFSVRDRTSSFFLLRSGDPRLFPLSGCLFPFSFSCFGAQEFFFFPRDAGWNPFLISFLLSVLREIAQTFSSFLPFPAISFRPLLTSSSRRSFSPFALRGQEPSTSPYEFLPVELETFFFFSPFEDYYSFSPYGKIFFLDVKKCRAFFFGKEQT